MCVRLPYQDVHFHDYFTVEVAAEYTIFDSQFPLSCNTVHTESLSRSLTHSETADATIAFARTRAHTTFIALLQSALLSVRAKCLNFENRCNFSLIISIVIHSGSGAIHGNFSRLVNAIPRKWQC